MERRNIFDLGFEAMQVLRPPRSTDDLLSDRFTRKCWSILLLFAIRDGANAVALRQREDEVFLCYRVAEEWPELVPPPPVAIAPMTAMIRQLGLPRTLRRRVASYFKRIVHMSCAPIGLPWESRFRLRLGHGLKDVFASETARPEGDELVLAFTDVTIDPFEAETALKRIWAGDTDKVLASQDGNGLAPKATL